VVVQLARLLHERGWRVGVAADGGDLEDSLPTGLSRYRIAGHKMTPAQIRRIVVRDGYAVVHAHQRGVALRARAGLLGARIPVVEHVHNTFLPVSRKFLSFRGDVVVACGSAIGAMVVHDYGRPADRVRTIRNATAAPEPQPDLGWRADGRTQLLAIGRLAEQKDPLRALDVISALERTAPGQFFLRWAGTGPLADRVAAEVRRRALPVELLGQVASGPALLPNADLLLLTSKWEGLPLVLLEAAAAGVPCVAPNIGSCSEVIHDRENGILFDPTSRPEEIAAAIVEASAHRETWSLSARQRYEEDFTEVRFIEEIEQAYEDARNQYRG